MADGSAIEAKLRELGMDQSPEEFVGSLPPHIKRRVEALQEIQAKKDEVEVQFRREKAELEAKYEKLYGPFYVERSQIVSGEKEVPAKEGEEAGDAKVKGIPDFWCSVLLKCDTTSEMIKDKDLEVLKSLTDIQAENIFEEGAPRGFKLVFHFASNPFFANKTLEKTYLMLPDDDGVLEKAVGTKIEWNAGKDVTVKIMKKKAKGKGGKEGKVQTKIEPIESFFNFFSPPDVPGEDDEVDEETMEELQSLIENDYEIGATIKEKLIAKAVSWYTGEAAEDEPYYFGDEDEEDFEEGEEGEDDDDDDDEDDEDDAPPPKASGKGGKGGKGAAAGGKAVAGAGGEQPPECKQS